MGAEYPDSFPGCMRCARSILALLVFARTTRAAADSGQSAALLNCKRRREWGLAAHRSMFTCRVSGQHGFPGYPRKELMTATGELIRMMNYVDDIAATLRRVNASLYLITPEEKRKLAEYMRKSDPSFFSVIEQLEKGS